MIAELIFLALGTWAFVISLYAIDLQQDKEELEKKLAAAQDAYLNMREFAQSQGLDTTCYGDKANG